MSAQEEYFSFAGTLFAKVAVGIWITFLCLGLLWSWSYHNIITITSGLVAVVLGIIFLSTEQRTGNRRRLNILLLGVVVVSAISYFAQRI